MKTVTHRVYNFNPGPAMLPFPVLEKIQQELLNYRETGMSVMEMTHRCKEFEAILENAKTLLKSLLVIPENYEILFLPGGARLQFAMIPMNLYLEGKPVDVLHTGEWSKQAIAELKKLTQYRLAGSTEDLMFTRLPDAHEIKLSANASYVHLVSNNTIYGTQWKTYPETGDVPLIGDMTSDILSRGVNVSKFGLIFASAQKNLGIAGVTIVIIRKDLLGRSKENLPVMLNYAEQVKGNSLVNTAPTFPIYVSGLVLEWVRDQGGVAAIQKANEEKAGILYDLIDASSLYQGTVRKQDRSMMNVVFVLRKGGEDLEKIFDKEASKNGLAGLKGHRSVGGFRASIYNAMLVEGVKALADFMKDFERKHA
ncbi:MAG: 3-phosphoserine/phosphohydroxythreonine transaminase [Candidatus Omnitrophica bacterium]|nr:3-phosphoserine/phosphohydroxythreonine transaminase [Candidatus Omnitrophota bacterium]